MKNLPIGISTLNTMLENNMVYVDKTMHVHQLAKTSGRYFLSRPRRFGKSLLIDTLKSLFEGREELFRGLYIHDKWDWARTFPVVKIDFVAGFFQKLRDLEDNLQTTLSFYEEKHQVQCHSQGITNKFRELIQKLYDKYKAKPVVLIDEYDKPLLDNMEDPHRMGIMRDHLRGFYAFIKDQDANIQFVLLTGVSKFSKVSIFSGINNLRDITLDANFATICGYTQNDLEISFADHLAGVDKEELKRWYNGYNFLGEPVYNPFDILLFIANQGQFRNYWFETGSPSFLIKLFQQNQYFLPDLENIEAGEELLSSFEVGKMEPTTILFQSGYLTIAKQDMSRPRILYQLKFPNFEVRTSFTNMLAQSYSNISSKASQYQNGLYDSLLAGDLTAFEKFIKRLFAGIPYRNFTNNDLPNYEGYYASVLYAFLASMNCQIIPEDITNQGQADMTIVQGNNIYVTEIKVIAIGSVDTHIETQHAALYAGKKNLALAQIQEMDYARKYTGQQDKRVFEVGMVFSQKERNLVQFDWAERH